MAHDADATVPGTDSAGNLVDHLLRCWLLIGLGLLLVGAALRDYHIGGEFEFLRTQCLVAEIVAGVGMAFCWGGAMHYLDAALLCRTPSGGVLPWFWRVVFLAQKRLLMVGQLAAMALVVAALAAFIFDKNIPGPDGMVLERGWSPAKTRSVAEP